MLSFGDEQDAEHADQQDGGLQEQRRGVDGDGAQHGVRPLPPCRSRASTTTATNAATSPPRLSTNWAAYRC